jgi:hypothetical protein
VDDENREWVDEDFDGERGYLGLEYHPMYFNNVER